MFNEKFKIAMTEADVVAMVAQSQEFQQIKVREEETLELEEHLTGGDCLLPVKGGVENTHGKVNILLQTYISRGNIEGFSLVSDLSYVSQNSSRIMRGLFDIAIKRAWSGMAAKLLSLSKSLSLQHWGFQHPLRQFGRLSHEIMDKLEDKKLTMDRMRDMTENEIGLLVVTCMSRDLLCRSHDLPSQDGEGGEEVGEGLSLSLSLCHHSADHAYRA